MAEEPGEKPKPDEGDVLELNKGQIVDPDAAKDKPDAGDGEDDEEVVASFGDEAAPASEDAAPEWVRDLRKRSRELERENAELKKSKVSVPEIGDKPTLETCDYDEERFETEYNSWLDRKAASDRAKTEATKAEEKAQERWQAELLAYGDQKDKLGVKDFDSAEEEVMTLLTPAQQAILVQGAEDKAKIVYALGKNPEKLRELASIQDPIKFAFAAARLEGQAKMERKRAATSPESDVRGSAPLGKTSDKQLERLEKEAEGSDRTKLIRYKKSKGLI